MPDQDFIDAMLALPPGHPVTALRMERADIRRHTEGAFQALVLPIQPGGVALTERARLATAAARLDGDEPLAAAFSELANPAPLDRVDTLGPYVDEVVVRPDQVDQQTVDRLRSAGLSPQDIVAITQLAAFVPFQVRLLAGLRAMASDDASSSTMVGPTTIRPAPGQYTMAEIAWSPRLPPVEAETATPDQLAALDACPPAVSRSVYFRTLALDPASLAERGALFERVMYAPRGLPRAERELATAVVSMVNGCVYCTSVHARRFAELSRDAPTMQRMLAEGFAVPLDARRRAIVDFAATLTATPAAVTAQDLVPLHAAGFAPLEQLDLIHAIAMFANANRLMQALGASTPPVAATS